MFVANGMHTVQHPAQVPIGLVEKQEKKQLRIYIFFAKEKEKKMK
jgi:hypothetical protein